MPPAEARGSTPTWRYLVSCLRSPLRKAAARELGAVIPNFTACEQQGRAADYVQITVTNVITGCRLLFR